METTGHHSLDGVCNYKWTSVEQQQVVSDILSLAKKPRNECSEPNDVSPPVHCSKKTTEHFRGGTQPNQGNIYHKPHPSHMRLVRLIVRLEKRITSRHTLCAWGPCVGIH